jgi:hypothetical protein
MVILTMIENESLQVFLKGHPQRPARVSQSNFATKWIGRTGQEDDALMRWPHRSPDLIPCEFFFWRFVKDTAFVPPLPANLRDLRNRITTSVALVNRDMLTRVWDIA